MVFQSVPTKDFALSFLLLASLSHEIERISFAEELEHQAVEVIGKLLVDVVFTLLENIVNHWMILDVFTFANF